MGIDTVVHALIDHFYSICPTFTISGTNDRIIVRDKSGEMILCLKFDGNLLVVDVKSIKPICHSGTRIVLGDDPQVIHHAYDLNKQEDLEEVEKLLITIYKLRV